MIERPMTQEEIAEEMRLDRLRRNERPMTQEEIERQFDYWEVSRGAYILSRERREELRMFLFNRRDHL